ncbi:unnamed protein product [Cylindrotheca closterium]|uniref:Reverse transcriptase domain-containing protein n=1 Tax=Cylindrotheca closterium TaxID=2856 RepID=A0AAD2CK74_9STRA|nr:unnamed protein product [Cylindrotheca closterium]
MYPSIDLEDAFLRIRNFLTTSPLCDNVSADPILVALEIIMKRNCFRFGDTYWLQTDGTAMGTPPAPSFAMLYYGIFEIDLLQSFGSSLHYLRRYIDDQFGIWIHHPDPAVDRQRWDEFKECQGNFCTLNWDFSTLLKTVNFLDLTLTVEPFHINTKLYEKPLNLHLYIPPNSARTSSVRLRLVTGGIFRILQLTSRDIDKKQSLAKFHSHLFARGYKLKFLNSAFETALQQFSKPRKEPVTPSSTDHLCFLHLPFHSRDPSQKTIQDAFHTQVLRPISRSKTFGRACNFELSRLSTDRVTWEGLFIQTPLPLVPKTEFEDYLYNIWNPHNRNRNGLIVAYSRPPNLKNLLFPRHVESKCLTARTVSTIQDELLDHTPSTEPN